jgi:hypothetical protein
MMQFLNLKQFAKCLCLVLIVYLLLTSVADLFLSNSLLDDSRSFVDNIESRISGSLKYKNGKWDTSLYNSDPLTPYPNASTVFPVYIITKSGFVLERSKPISGYLDAADKDLIGFTEPTTISTVINENWRLLSRKITSDGSEIGVVTISYYNPNPEVTDLIDKQLRDNMQRVVDQINIKDGELDLSNFDERKIDYNLALQIVTNTNHIILSDGRTPSFIDPSYVDTELQNPDFRIIQDAKSKESFLIKSLAIKDENGSIIGVIVVGRSISFISRIQFEFLKFASIFGVIIVPVLAYLLSLFLTYEVTKRSRELTSENGLANTPKVSLHFDEQNSELLIDGKSVAIVYASNQSLLLKALFSEPDKRWENDELLDYFGEESHKNSYKKVYDTAIALNKKLGFKLIIYQDRTYKLNPELRNLVS